MVELREYQRLSVERAIAENVIINLDTGLGKTLIAVRTYDHFARADCTKLTLFAVPTVELVAQQADVMRRQAEVLPVVAKLCGMTMEAWDAARWRDCAENSNVRCRGVGDRSPGCSPRQRVHSQGGTRPPPSVAVNTSRRAAGRDIGPADAVRYT